MARITHIQDARLKKRIFGGASIEFHPAQLLIAQLDFADITVVNRGDVNAPENRVIVGAQTERKLRKAGSLLGITGLPETVAQLQGLVFYAQTVCGFAYKLDGKHITDTRAVTDTLAECEPALANAFLAVIAGDKAELQSIFERNGSWQWFQSRMHHKDDDRKEGGVWHWLRPGCITT